MTAAALWPSGLLVFLTRSLTDCLDLIGAQERQLCETVFPPKPTPDNHSITRVYGGLILFLTGMLKPSGD